MPEAYSGPLERIDACRWRIPRSYKPGMRVDGVIYADDSLIGTIKADKSPEQVANVACLPGIVGNSLAMPDIHWGYGFCIGGVAATDPDEGGVISPGGVGYDIPVPVAPAVGPVAPSRVDKAGECETNRRPRKPIDRPPSRHGRFHGSVLASRNPR